jgi:hypothetical protein
MPSELTNFWGKCELAVPPFAHPGDRSILWQKSGRFIDPEPTNFESFIAGPRFGDFDDHRLLLSLLPVPYAGDLRHAEFVILLLNPGFSYTDYWAESKRPEFRQRRIVNLRQSFEGVDFPFMELDPQFCWHSGFVWWEKKLRDVITVISQKKLKGHYVEALRDLSRRLASVELVPYHSPSFRAHALINHLPSVKMVQKFVRESLVPAANAGKRTIIVTRQAKAWALPPGTRNLVIYKGGATRGASLSPNSEGGKAILRRYDIFWSTPCAVLTVSPRAPIKC